MIKGKTKPAIFLSSVFVTLIGVLLGFSQIFINVNSAIAETPATTSARSDWYTDFEYDLDNTAATITLKKYIGAEDAELIIPEKATINGKEYATGLAQARIESGIHKSIFSTSEYNEPIHIKSLVFEKGVHFPDDCSWLFERSSIDHFDNTAVDMSNVKKANEMFSSASVRGSLYIDETSLEEYKVILANVNRVGSMVWAVQPYDDAAYRNGGGFRIYTKGVDMVKTFKIVDQKLGHGWTYYGGQLDGQYTVTFDANGGKYAPTPVKISKGGHLGYDSAIWGDDRGILGGGTLNDRVYAPNKICIGWNTKPDGSGTFYKKGDVWNGSSNETLYAVYKDYTNTYSSNGKIRMIETMNEVEGYPFRPWNCWGTSVYGITDDLRNYALLSSEEQTVLITAVFYSELYKDVYPEASYQQSGLVRWLGEKFGTGYSIEYVRQHSTSNEYFRFWQFYDKYGKLIGDHFTYDYAFTDGGDSGSAFTQFYIIPNLKQVKDYEIPITKEWQDNGATILRKNVEIELYNIQDTDNPVQTLNLTKKNADKRNANVWKGTFEKVPLLNEDGTIAEYIIKEKKIEHYDTFYPKRANAIKIKFENLSINPDFYVIPESYKKHDLSIRVRVPANTAGEIVVPIGDIYVQTAPYGAPSAMATVIKSLEYVYVEPEEFSESETSRDYNHGRIEVSGEWAPVNGEYHMELEQGDSYYGAGYKLIFNKEIPTFLATEAGSDTRGVINKLSVGTIIPREEIKKTTKIKESVSLTESLKLKNPKTGDTNLLLYVATGLIALLLMLVFTLKLAERD